MPTNESVQLYLRLIQEKHNILVSESSSLIRVLAGINPDEKLAVAQKVLQIASDLRAILSTNDVPSWLSEAIAYLTQFISANWTSSDFITNFISTKLQLDKHQWSFNQVKETAFDFDAIFEHFKNESRLPELFDQIIRILEEIEASNAVDSITMIRGLGKVIATIKKCKDGSYFSLNSAWEFLLSFLKNYMWGELSKLPILGTALEALEKTIKETNEEMFKVHKKVQDEMVQTVTTEIPALSNKSAFQFITYDKSGRLPTNGN